MSEIKQQDTTKELTDQQTQPKAMGRGKEFVPILLF